jgi:hypothetical protein
LQETNGEKHDCASPFHFAAARSFT